MKSLDETPQDEPGHDQTDTGSDLDVAVTAHQSAPGRTVFTEDGNTDAWIATDLAVDLTR